MRRDATTVGLEPTAPGLTPHPKPGILLRLTISPVRRGLALRYPHAHSGTPSHHRYFMAENRALVERNRNFSLLANPPLRPLKLKRVFVGMLGK